MSNDRTQARRQAAYQSRLIAAGGRRITLRVPPEIAERMDAERNRTGESNNALILRLLQNSLPQ